MSLVKFPTTSESLDSRLMEKGKGEGADKQKGMFDLFLTKQGDLMSPLL
jgi:hypothetical protein